jgi:YfiH family protein
MPEIILADNLDGLPGIRHGFFTSAWGDCGYAKGEAAGNENIPEGRRRVAENFGLAPESLLSCFQIHSPDVVTVTKPWSVADRPKADAMVTREKGLALGILTADCVPILFADKSVGVIGAAHAGWRGAISGVIENTIKAMEALGATRSSTTAALGPCIAQKSYEVGPEFPAPFLAEDAQNEKFFRPAFRSGHTMFDLPGYVVAKLKRLGLVSVSPAPADTCAEPEHFFSYRRSTLQGVEREGSLISVIVLAG